MNLHVHLIATDLRNLYVYDTVNNVVSQNVWAKVRLVYNKENYNIKIFVNGILCSTVTNSKLPNRMEINDRNF